MSAPHPLLAYTLLALRGAAQYQPQSPDDLAQILDTLSGPDDANLLTALTDLLDHLASCLRAVPGLSGGAHGCAASRLIAAAELLGPVAENLDHARADIKEATR